MSVSIQPFIGVELADVSFITKEFSRYKFTITTWQAIELPASAYVSSRNRYRADSLIDFLSRRTPDGTITVGITHRDISTTKGTIADWGVMGLGYCPGRACIASTHRLAKSNRQEQLFKVAIHELGHTQGLQHCETRNCLMRDAEGGNPTDQLKDFCKTCKIVLESKGFYFPPE